MYGPVIVDLIATPEQFQERLLRIRGRRHIVDVLVSIQGNGNQRQMLDEGKFIDPSVHAVVPRHHAIKLGGRSAGDVLIRAAQHREYVRECLGELAELIDGEFSVFLFHALVLPRAEDYSGS